MSSNQRCKTHKYKRFSANSKVRRGDIYYCVYCSSYKHITMMTGTHTLCWQCGQEFIMGDTSPLKPKCHSCTGDKKIVSETVSDLVNKLMEKI